MIKGSAGLRPFDVESLRRTPIPELPSNEGYQSKPIAASTEALVPLGILSAYPLYTDAIYAGEHSTSPYPGGLPGSSTTVFVREHTAQRLAQIEARLPIGLHLVIFDGYRSIELQQALWNTYQSELARVHPEMSQVTLDEITKHYVSAPSANPTHPSTHNTGGSVDVALIEVPYGVDRLIRSLDGQPIREDKEDYRLLKHTGRFDLITLYARQLEFGTPFDYGKLDTKGHLDYFERLAKKRRLSETETTALQNRRLLYHIMHSAGLEPYQKEWWHYNAPETQMGAQAAGLAIATYGAIGFPKELVHFEQRRNELTQRLLVRATHLPGAAVIKP